MKRAGVAHPENVMFKLKCPQHPSPIWFNRGALAEHVGRVLPNGTVDAVGHVLELLQGELPPAGTEVIVNLYRDYVSAEPADEYRARVAREKAEEDARRKAYHEERARDLRQRQDRAQKRAEEVNGALNIPVRWTSGLKTVLSGLSQNSSGTGDNARSVAHVLLLEPVTEGRFERPAKTFLCTSSAGSNGKVWTERLHTRSHGSQSEYVSEITCRQCLKLAQRWTDTSARIEPELVTD
ncbi:hypothetical protein [Paraburkholderia youngii]|uniref:hypothetical protein n=1 Tax=Paraburkholderia youngii TaxID=2782701 RepID=UPI003D1C4AF0